MDSPVLLGTWDHSWLFLLRGAGGVEVLLIECCVMALADLTQADPAAWPENRC